MPATVAEHYRTIRAENPLTTAQWALDGARHEAEVDALERAAVWTTFDVGGPFLPFMVASFGEVEIRVYSDDEPYEWGDEEPSENERRDLQVIGVGVAIEGDDDDLDACWGIAYLDGNTERAALSFAVEAGYLQTGREVVAARDLANATAAYCG